MAKENHKGLIPKCFSCKHRYITLKMLKMNSNFELQDQQRKCNPFWPFISEKLR